MRKFKLEKIVEKKAKMLKMFKKTLNRKNWQKNVENSREKNCQENGKNVEQTGKNFLSSARFAKKEPKNRK